MTYVLGVDIGSTSIKGCVLDLMQTKLGPVHQVAFPEPLASHSPLYHEVDVASVVAGVRQVLKELVAECPSARHAVFCSQMGGLILTDRQGGALGNYISWRDQRMLSRNPDSDTTYWYEFRQRTTRDDLRRNGNELQPGSTISLLYWLAVNRSLPDSSFLAMQLGDYVVARLCDAGPCTEATMALGTIDLTTFQRCDEWVKRLGCVRVEWPAILPPSQPVGVCRIGEHPITCFPSIGDHQAALRGVGLRPRELSINVSTGSQVSLLTESLQLGDYQTRPYGDGRYLNTLTHLPAGRALNGLIDLLSELSQHEGYAVRDPWSIIEKEVESLRSTRYEEESPEHEKLDIHLSFFAGPLGEEGSVHHIRLDNLTIGHWFHAAFRRMAKNYALCAARLGDASCYDTIALSGGLVQRLKVLREMIAEEFSCPARLIEFEEETLRGLLTIAKAEIG